MGRNEGNTVLKHRWLWPEFLVEGFEAWQAAGLHALKGRWLWPESLVEAAAKPFKGLKPGTAGTSSWPSWISHQIA